MSVDPLHILVSVSKKQSTRGYSLNQVAYSIACRRGSLIHTHWACKETDAGHDMAAEAIIRVCDSYLLRNLSNKIAFFISYATNIEDGINFERSSIERLGTVNKQKSTKKSNPELWRNLYNVINTIDYSLSEIINCPDKELLKAAQTLSSSKATAFRNRSLDEAGTWTDNNELDWLDFE